MWFMWFVCAFYTALVAASKDRSFWGWFWIGCVLGYFGPLLMLLVPEKEITFPDGIEEYMKNGHDDLQ